MKKFGLFISIALLTAFVGCDSDDVEDPVVPAVSKPVVAVSENTPTSFGVEWDAVDEAAGYQYVVTESDAAGNTSEFCPETQTDKTSLRFDDAAAGAKYTVKVKALAAADSPIRNMPKSSSRRRPRDFRRRRSPSRSTTPWGTTPRR
mgnify:CR=1 FL=1